MASDPPISQQSGSSEGQAIFAALRDALAALYPIDQDARRVVEDAGLTVIQITFSPRAQTNWHNILLRFSTLFYSPSKRPQTHRNMVASGFCPMPTPSTSPTSAP